MQQLLIKFLWLFRRAGWWFTRSTKNRIKYPDY
jgi:hypothetical protein